jgi:hypothetical protein
MFIEIVLQGGLELRCKKGDATLRINTFKIMTVSIPTLSITTKNATFSIMTLSS